MYFLNTLPQTGETVKNYGLYAGIAIILAVVAFIIWRKKNDKDSK